MNASQLSLENLVGKRVRTTREFSGIAPGTIGIVDEYYKIGRGHSGIMVKWKTTSGHEVRDGFGRDNEFDETQWLEIVE